MVAPAIAAWFGSDTVPRTATFALSDANNDAGMVRIWNAKINKLTLLRME
jgi:hypothetical protein